MVKARAPCAQSISPRRSCPTLAFCHGVSMARHHVISTTACDVFFKLVAHQKKSLGARFDSMK